MYRVGEIGPSEVRAREHGVLQHGTLKRATLIRASVHHRVGEVRSYEHTHTHTHTHTVKVSLLREDLGTVFFLLFFIFFIILIPSKLAFCARTLDMVTSLKLTPAKLPCVCIYIIRYYWPLNTVLVVLKPT